MDESTYQRIWEAPPAALNRDGWPVAAIEAICEAVTEELTLRFKKWQCACPRCRDGTSAWHDLRELLEDDKLQRVLMSVCAAAGSVVDKKLVAHVVDYHVPAEPKP